MIWPTHVLGGIVFLSIAEKLGIIHGNKIYIAIWLTLSIIGSLLPDIDNGKSFMGRKNILSIAKHRGLFHNLLVLFVLIILSIMIKGLIGMALLSISIGYASHLFLDALTIQGIPFIKGRIRGPIKTSSTGELIVFILLLVLLLLFPL